MEDKIKKFMMGRHGVDELSTFLLFFGIILSIVLRVVNQSQASGAVMLAFFIISYFRILSRNTYKRNSENYKFLQITRPLREFFGKIKRRTLGTKDYKYFSCPQCKKELRVPKKKGRIKIRCPECKSEFYKKS